MYKFLVLVLWSCVLFFLLYQCFSTFLLIEGSFESAKNTWMIVKNHQKYTLWHTKAPRLPDKRLKIVQTWLLTKSTCCHFTMPCHQTTEMTLITIIGVCEYVSLLFYCNSVVLSIGLRGTSSSSWEAMQFISSHSKFAALLLLSLWVDRMFNIDFCWLSFLCFDNNHFCSWLARDVTKPEQIITFTLSMKHSNATLTQNFSKAAVLYFLTFWVIIIFLWQIL